MNTFLLSTCHECEVMKMYNAYRCLNTLSLIFRLSSYLIVCAHIQHDRQALLRRHTSTGCVEGQLAHWDAHTIAAQIPKPQDPLSISHTHSLFNMKNSHK